MGRSDPTRAVEAAKSSGQFSALGIELYELLVLTPHGATLSGLVSKPALMELFHPRVGISEPNPPAEQVATALRESMRHTCEELPHDPAKPAEDRPGAARTLLGLEAGYEGLPRAARRQRASMLLVCDVRSLTKTRYPSRGKGEYKASPELKLMEQLGQQLLLDEYGTLKSRARSADDSAELVLRLTLPHWHLHRAWDALHRLVPAVEHAVAARQGGVPRSAYLAVCEELIQRWWNVLMTFESPEGSPDNAFLRLRDEMWGMSPINAAQQRISEVADRNWGEPADWTPPDFDTEDSSLRLLDDWLSRCPGCKSVDRADWTPQLTTMYFNGRRFGPDDGSQVCPVHFFAGAATKLEKAIEAEWGTVTMAMRSPEAFAYLVEQDIAKKYGITIDKRVKSSYFDYTFISG
jgi:hypothetical protein